MIEDTKECMAKLLKDTIFDEFLCTSFEMVGFYKINIDGQIRMEYLSPEEKEIIGERRYIKWVDLKQNIFEMIKGRKTPTTLKVVFGLKDGAKDSLLEKINFLESNAINNFTFSFIYENKRIKIVTGTNYATFTLDKQAEQYFDDNMLKFFKKHDIATMLTVD
jgi:hypothetical protein